MIKLQKLQKPPSQLKTTWKQATTCSNQQPHIYDFYHMLSKGMAKMPAHRYHQICINTLTPYHHTTVSTPYHYRMVGDNVIPSTHAPTSTLMMADLVSITGGTHIDCYINQNCVMLTPVVTLGTVCLPYHQEQPTNPLAGQGANFICWLSEWHGLPCHTLHH